MPLPAQYSGSSAPTSITNWSDRPSTLNESTRAVAAWRRVASCARLGLGLPVSARSCLIGLTPRNSALNSEKSSSCMGASAKAASVTKLAGLTLPGSIALFHQVRR